MVELLRERINEISGGWVLAGLGLIIIVFQVVVLVMAGWRRGGGRAPLSLKAHAIAGALIALLPVAGWITVQASREVTLGVYAGGNPDPSMNATLLSQGLYAQIDGILLILSATLLVSLPWFAGMALTLRAPRADGRARRFPPAVLVGAGLLPLAVGAIQWSFSLLKTFYEIAGTSPEMKGAVLESGVDVAGAQLALFAGISKVGIAILAAIAVVVIVRRGRQGGAGAPPSPQSARRALALSTAAVGLAALLVVEARPMAADNALPWPPPLGFKLVDRGGPPTPDLVGPDAPDRAPVVKVFRDRMTLDGWGSVAFGELEAQLVILHHNFTLLHPGEEFNELVLIEADQATPMADLASLLSAVRGASYHRPMFVFTKVNTHVRPVIGKLERVVATGARIEVAYAGEDAGESKNAVPLRLQDFADYGAFARRLVELRRAGKPVLVKVERSSR